MTEIDGVKFEDGCLSYEQESIVKVLARCQNVEERIAFCQTEIKEQNEAIEHLKRNLAARPTQYEINVWICECENIIYICEKYLHEVKIDRV